MENKDNTWMETFRGIFGMIFVDWIFISLYRIFVWDEKENCGGVPRIIGWFGLAAVCFCCYAVYKSATTPSTVSYCPVETGDLSYAFRFHLKGVKSWSQDITIGSFSSFDEAVEKAKQINCPIK